MKAFVGTGNDSVRFDKDGQMCYNFSVFHREMRGMRRIL